MKTIYNILIVSSLIISGASFASASYYHPDRYQYQNQNQYLNYQNQNYTYSNYVPNPSTLTNCYYSASYPPVYYGNCSGMNYNYTYPTNTQYNNNYQYVYQNNYTQQYTYPTQSYYPTNTTYPASNYTYGYYNGSWYPGYSHSTIGDLFTNNNYNTYSNNTCYYQNGYLVCY